MFLTVLPENKNVVVLSFIMGLKRGLLMIYSGSIWAGLFEHTYNNSIVNLVHVSTSTRADEMQVFEGSICSTFIIGPGITIWLYQEGEERKAKIINT